MKFYQLKYCNDKMWYIHVGHGIWGFDWRRKEDGYDWTRFLWPFIIIHLSSSVYGSLKRRTVKLPLQEKEEEK